MTEVVEAAEPMADDASRLQTLTRRVRAIAGDAPVVASRLWQRSRPVLGVVTTFGWTVLLAGVIAYVVAARFGWVELRVLAAACFAALLLSALTVLGRTRLDVSLQLDPSRVVAGESAAGRVVLVNRGRGRLRSLDLELPVGETSARFSLPDLGVGAEHEELFVIPTTRRGVIDVGPATTVRADPLGLLQRVVPWTARQRLYVHPRTVPLEGLNGGLLRDLEGRTTEEISNSDLAFHALREYTPGDDRRHIHWKTSAKVGAFADDGKFMVRQYLDTRRSHFVLVVDGERQHYLADDDFETAVSVAASVVVRAYNDEMDVTVVVADQASHDTPADVALDAFSLASMGDGRPIAQLAQQGIRLAPDASLVIFVTGAHTEVTDLLRAAVHFPNEVRRVALVIDPTRPVGLSEAGSLTLLHLPHLGDLPALLRGGGMQ